MISISQLDVVLSLFDYDDKNHGLNGKDVRKKLREIDVEFEINFQNEILAKLVKDGNLRVVPKINVTIDNVFYNEVPYYLLTFEGGILKDEGGYSNACVERQNQIKYEKIKDNLLIVGSWIAGIGTLILATVEIWKIFHPSSH